MQHFVIDAKDPIQLAPTDSFYAYVYLDPKNPPKQVMLQFNDGSWEHRAYWGQDKISFGGVGQNTPGHRPVGDLPAAGGWVRLSVKPDQVGLKIGDKINGIAFTQFDGLAYWDETGVNRSGTGLEPDLEVVLLKDAGQRTEQEAASLQEHFRLHGGYVDPRGTQRDQIQQQVEAIEKDIPRTLVSESAAPRMTRILPRGNWLDDSGEVVQPAIPAFLGKLAVGDRRATRLDLAQWLVKPDNPLIARTFVNRVWKLMFGAGLSRIVDDLGSQGQPPTHPELLDWLARQFVESQWDVKALARLIVTSQAYQRDSSRPEAMRHKDPLNRWLASQTPLRLNAEMVRDNALAVSGLLVEMQGGPSVKPYQPVGYWQHLNFPRRTYQADKGSDQYRRGVYTHWQRSFLHPSLMAFDAPSREECTAERPRSNTPLQALVLLNDPTYVESARSLAEHVCVAAKDDRARMDAMFRRVLLRTPTDGERPLLVKLLADQTARFAADPAAAKALLGVGLHPVSDKDTVSLAAWTSVARAILNLHETITRN